MMITDKFVWQILGWHSSPNEKLILLKYCASILLQTLDISRSNITRYWTQYDREKSKILFKLWTHQKHLIPCLQGGAMRCLFWDCFRKYTARYRDCTPVPWLCIYSVRIIFKYILRVHNLLRQTLLRKIVYMLIISHVTIPLWFG